MHKQLKLNLHLDYITIILNFTVGFTNNKYYLISMTNNPEWKISCDHHEDGGMNLYEFIHQLGVQKTECTVMSLC